VTEFEWNVGIIAEPTALYIVTLHMHSLWTAFRRLLPSGLIPHIRYHGAGSFILSSKMPVVLVTNLISIIPVIIEPFVDPLIHIFQILLAEPATEGSHTLCTCLTLGRQCASLCSQSGWV